ncbi:hypothetical protein RRG08_009360 [Elysia crispata]|uniref:C2H2-type domain-containing protein n=1 Tax=Elysia crispata TaxID=231223 RepID=A0AAE1D8J4_9GAST|nr:hypothetical protein RRG08_009360 [Elysia crispata]
MPRKNTCITCDHCDKVFTRTRDYEKHRYAVKGEKAYVCEVCGKQYASALGLRMHLASHRAEKPYRCDKCRKSFSSSNGLDHHKLTHSGEGPFTCDLCGKRFRHKAHLENHCVTHLGLKSHQCEICGLAYFTKKEMYGHQKIHPNKDDAKGTLKRKLSLYCEICGKIYHSQVGLDTHLKQHSGEKPFTCEVCGKAYTNSAGLLYHQKTHSGEKRYTCETCGRSFSSHGGLEIHLRTHTGEKPFCCDVCHLCFGSRSNLHAHQRAHTRAWLAAQHEVMPKPVSASALKMRKYREKLRADPSLAPPSLQGKPKWRPKKAETLKRYREKLKVLDRLRTLPKEKEFQNERLVHSVLELNGHLATEDNMEAASQQILTLLPHNLVVVSSPQDEATPAMSSVMTAAAPSTSLAKEIHCLESEAKKTSLGRQQLDVVQSAGVEEMEPPVSIVKTLAKSRPNQVSSALNQYNEEIRPNMNSLKYQMFLQNPEPVFTEDHTLYTVHPRLLVWPDTADPRSLLMESQVVYSNSFANLTTCSESGEMSDHREHSANLVGGTSVI